MGFDLKGIKRSVCNLVVCGSVLFELVGRTDVQTESKSTICCAALRRVSSVLKHLLPLALGEERQLPLHRRQRSPSVPTDPPQSLKEQTNHSQQTSSRSSTG